MDLDKFLTRVRFRRFTNGLREANNRRRFLAVSLNLTSSAGDDGTANDLAGDSLALGGSLEAVWPSISLKRLAGLLRQLSADRFVDLK